MLRVRRPLQVLNRVKSLQSHKRDIRLLSSSTTAAPSSSSSSAVDSTSSVATTTTTKESTTNATSSSSFPSSSSVAKHSVLALSCLTVGFLAGQAYRDPNQQPHHHHQHQERVLPNGLPRTCCESDKDEKRLYDNNLTDEQKELPKKLRRLMGRDNVRDGQEATVQTLPFLKGARLGQGRAYLVLTPEKLQQVIDAVQLIVDADCVVQVQGQNTGLVGGSTPLNSPDDDRPIVLLSMTQLNSMFPIDKGERMVCLAGAGLASLHRFLQEHFPDRESHSVLGSTFLNPTTAAGVSLGSGGTQLRKGPAYTDRALYLTIDETKWGVRQVHVHNTLGIQGLADPSSDNPHQRKLDQTASRVDRWGRYVAGKYERTMRYSTPQGREQPAHDVTYGERLCGVASASNSENDTQDDNDAEHQISRFNADTRGSDPNRSEGKVVILATVHDTFPKPQETKTFWVSFDSLETALQFRRQVCLDNAQDLPISLEYMDQDTYEVVDGAGRVLSNTILLVGTTSSVLRHLWNFKLWVEALPFQGANLWIDKLLYYANFVNPPSLPRPIRTMSRQYPHHAAMTVGEFGNGELARLQERLQQFAKEHGEEKIKVYECQRKWELQSLSAFRFAAAPAFRTYCVGKGLQGFSVDYALPKTKGQVPPLTATADEQAPLPLKRMRYSHFGCNVVHEDLAYPADADIGKAKYALKHAVENVMGGKLPSEHGHGREYQAPPQTQERWKRLDPLNVLNPGIGGLSYKYKYQ